MDKERERRLVYSMKPCNHLFCLPPSLLPQPEDDPLNSDDDAGSENNEEEGEVESTIVCQWEKVYRVKAKWKFQLKDGIMHVGGHDYVFHKASGEADW